MKRMFSALLILGLFSCTDTIDKKLSRDSFQDDVEEIKKKHAAEYSEADFVEFRERASNQLTAQMIGMNKSDNSTYRSVLDTVKAQRLRDEKEIAEYNRLLSDLSKNMEVEVVDCALEEGRFLSYMHIRVRAKNNFNQPVKAFEGQVSVHNLLDNQVDEYYVDRTDSMPSGFNGVFVHKYATDKYSSLEQGDFKKLKFKWEPWKVVLNDGSVIERPKKPVALLRAEL